ncbi:hypothetical protein D3C71_1433780 [compost metagenome]
MRQKLQFPLAGGVGELRALRRGRQAQAAFRAQDPHAIGRQVGGADTVVETAAGRHGTQNGGVEMAVAGGRVVAVVAATHHIFAHGAFRPGGGRRQVAAGTEQIHARGRCPQREPAPAFTAMPHALVGERGGVEQPGAPRVGHAAQHEVAACVQTRRRISEHEHRAAAAKGTAGGIRVDTARVELIPRARTQVEAADGTGGHA